MSTQIIASETQLPENETQETALQIVFSAETIERLDLDRSCTLPVRKATRLYYQPDQISETDHVYGVSCECGFHAQEPEMVSSLRAFDYSNTALTSLVTLRVLRPAAACHLLRI